MTDVLSELDEAALVEASDPDCIAVVLAIAPELDPSIGAVELRKRAREVFDTLPPFPIPDGVRVRDVDAAGHVPALRIYEPDARAVADAGILWIHGGGMIAGSALQDDFVCSALVVDHGCPVVSVEYQLAPEAPYPAAVEECLAALRWTLGAGSGLGIAPGRLVVEGASAGGGLAAGVALLARDRGVTGIGAVLLRYPMLDDRPGRPSVERLTARRVWNRDMNRLGWQSYLGDLDPVPIYAAPGRASVDELRGLPPVFVDVGTLDAFFDEDTDFARRLARADVPVELVVTPRAFHGSELCNPQASTSRRIIDARRSARARFLAP